MGISSRLLNRPGSHAETATGWFERAADDLATAGREYAELSDAELTAAAGEVFASGTQQETLTRYCALAREAGERALHERAYDTQLRSLNGLLQGNVVQIATGASKTLVGAPPAAGYALQRRRVHV